MTCDDIDIYGMAINDKTYVVQSIVPVEPITHISPVLQYDD